jgi:hypothetical protein
MTASLFLLHIWPGASENIGYRDASQLVANAEFELPDPQRGQEQASGTVQGADRRKSLLIG